MFDKEIKYYNVNVGAYVSASGKYSHYKTIRCYTEERAVKLAREYIANETAKIQS